MHIATPLKCIPSSNIECEIERPTSRATLIANLKQCGNRKDLHRGKLLHSDAIEAGCHRNTYVATALISMYSKCGSVQYARGVFDKMHHHDVVSWTALILGYVENGESSVALEVFDNMDCSPNGVAFLAALRACAGFCVRKGMSIHRKVTERGFDEDVLVANTLVDMYSKCRDMVHARCVFDRMSSLTVVSWNVLIFGYVGNGESSVALEMFNTMDCAPDSVTFVSALRACIENREKGFMIHKLAKERGFDKAVFVGSALVDMYSKCGDMIQAREVFNRMRHRDVVSWTSLILGYVENGESSVALGVFNCMDCAPNSVTFVAALKACTSLGALETGQRIHEQLRRLGLEHDQMVASCLVDFYGKCGNMTAAEEVFNRMRSRDIVSWNALIGGYSLLGNASQVISLVKRMEETGLQMNGVTMLLILSTCSHAGVVEEGQSYFKSMSKYGINPTLEHYTCMVDILGRANKLQEALSLVREMPFEPNNRVWMTLLGACRKWNNVEIGKVAYLALLAGGVDKELVGAASSLMQNIHDPRRVEETSAVVANDTKEGVGWQRSIAY